MAVYGGWVPAAHLADFDTTSTLRPNGTTEGWTSEEVARDSLLRLLKFYRSPRTGAGARGMAGRMRETLVREIAAQGYARLLPTKFTDISQAWEAWAYPPLDGELASHFIDPVFAARNNLRLVTEGGERLLVTAAAAAQASSLRFISHAPRGGRKWRRGGPPPGACRRRVRSQGFASAMYRSRSAVGIRPFTFRPLMSSIGVPLKSSARPAARSPAIRS